MTLHWSKGTRQFGFLQALGLTGLTGLLAARFLPLDRLPFWRCALREHTGWPCPGCGLTRVAQRVAQGDIGGALDANPLGTVVALGFAACALFATLQLLFRLPTPVLRLDAREQRIGRVAVLAAVVANYAVVVVRVRFLGLAVSPLWTGVALVIAGYLLGSVPWGVLVARRLGGVDVRTVGSGNIGATNVARAAGKAAGALVLALDAGKGALAVWLARAVLPGATGIQTLAGLAAFAGHVAPVWLRFKGGKGVATALGVLAMLVPAAALAGALTFGVVFALTRISSLGSLAAGPAALAAASVWPGTRLAVGLVATLYLAMLWTHRGNIRRLVGREERKL